MVCTRYVAIKNQTFWPIAKYRDAGSRKFHFTNSFRHRAIESNLITNRSWAPCMTCHNFFFRAISVLQDKKDFKEIVENKYCISEFFFSVWKSLSFFLTRFLSISFSGIDGWSRTPRSPGFRRSSGMMQSLEWFLFHFLTLEETVNENDFFYLLLRGLQEMKALLVLMVDVAERYDVVIWYAKIGLQF